MVQAELFREVIDPEKGKILAPYQVDSITSRYAARQIDHSASALREQVYTYLKEKGAHGATDEEIQLGLSMSGSTERPRRGELVKAGLVEEAEYDGLPSVRHTISGRLATVWRIKRGS